MRNLWERELVHKRIEIEKKILKTSDKKEKIKARKEWREGKNEEVNRIEN